MASRTASNRAPPSQATISDQNVPTPTSGGIWSDASNRMTSADRNHSAAERSSGDP